MGSGLILREEHRLTLRFDLVLRNEHKMTVSFEVLTAVTVKFTVFLDVTSCALGEVYRRFGTASCIHV